MPAKGATGRVIGATVGILLLAGVFVAGRWSAGANHPARPARQVPVNVGWPGASRMVGGMPVGYAHTREGAAAAATNYVQLLGGAIALSPAATRRAVAAVAAPSQEGQLATQSEQGLAELNNRTQALTYAGRGVPVVLLRAPITYQIESYTPTRAVVAIWDVAVLAIDGVDAPIQDWERWDIVLLWERGDWRDSVERTIQPGPVPQLTQEATADTALPPELRYQEYGHAPR